jgi:hypothetical protein
MRHALPVLWPRVGVPTSLDPHQEKHAQGPETVSSNIGPGHKMPYVVRPLSTWGETYGSRDPIFLARLNAKLRVLVDWWINGRSCIFALRIPGQRAPTREGQTFLVSYLYNDPLDIVNDPHVQASGLGVHIVPGYFGGQRAWLVIFYDHLVDIDILVRYLPVIERHFAPHVWRADDEQVASLGAAARRTRN